MGAWFQLYNFTRRERVGAHLAASKPREFIWNTGPGAVVLWYLFSHRGDKIAFVSDYDCDEKREFFNEVVTRKLLESFTDKTEETIAAAIAAELIEDHGFTWRDEQEPDQYFIRDVRIRNPH